MRAWCSSIPDRTLRPFVRSSLYRRKLAYPLLTLSVAAMVYFYSRGQLTLTKPATRQEYESFAREVMEEVRAGRPLPSAIDPVLEQVFVSVAPQSVRDASGGRLTFELTGPADPAAGLSHIQSVVVRAPNGEGVGLSISILAGPPDLVGVSRVSPTQGALAPSNGAATP